MEERGTSVQEGDPIYNGFPRSSSLHVHCLLPAIRLSVFCCCLLCPSLQAFELATGDYLFEPHSGEDYSRDEGSYAAEY
jgi:hypothetical protein